MTKTRKVYFVEGWVMLDDAGWIKGGCVCYAVSMQQCPRITLLFLFYFLLLLIDNQSVLLPPEDELDEYIANFLPYFFFGEK